MGSPATPIRVDRDAVATFLDEAARPRPGAWGRWVLTFAGLFLLLVVVPQALGGGARAAVDPLGYRLWVGIAIAAALAWWIVRWPHGRVRTDDPDDMVRRIEAEWSWLTRPGWPWRFALLGLALGAAIGVPVGSLLAYTTPAAESPGGSRLLGVAAFIALSWVWTVPMAFVVRQIAVRSHRRFIVTGHRFSQP